MSKKKEAHHIIEAALALAAERGWQALSLSDIAAELDISFSEVIEHFPSKTALLLAYSHYVDEQVVRGDLPDADEPLRDRLFDVIMRRFEVMNPHKAGLKVILRDSGTDPVALLCGAQRFYNGMALTLEAAGVTASGLSGMIRTEALSAIYAYTFGIWLKDESPDLARTMASLDKALRRAEDMASLLGRRRSGPSQSENEAAGHPS